MTSWKEIPLKLVSTHKEEDGGLSFEMQNSSFAGLKINDTYYPLYLEAGNDLHISIGSGESSSAISFSGEGSIANNYLTGITATIDAFYQTNGEFWRSETHVA
ncbi:MAG: hypothetical protein AAGD28_30905, partial [Bacteroidota bacterium]